MADKKQTQNRWKAVWSLSCSSNLPVYAILMCHAFV